MKASKRPLREDLVLQACLEAYALVRREGRLADRALDFTLRRKSHLYSSERREVAERVYALLRHQRTIDYLLGQAKFGFEHLKASEQDLLRLCAAWVLQGQSPEAVARSAGLGPPQRQFLQSLPEAVSAQKRETGTEAFAIQASVPSFLAELLLNRLGDEARQLADALNQRAPLTCRANALKIDRAELQQRLRKEGIESRPTPFSPFGLFLETRVNAFSLTSFREGLFEIQDEGSQLLGMLVDAPPTRVVDACAGAGGKTLQLAAQMKNRGEIFALDVDSERLSELGRRARRAGVHNVRTQVIAPEGDFQQSPLASLEGKADRVLVDAPCSGTGTYRRKPDARYRLTPEELTHHVERQKRLLHQFARCVKPGGRLIYGTCSILEQENEEVVSAFLSSHPDFSVFPVADVLETKLADRLQTGPFLRVWPHRHHTDGFFGAVLQKAKTSSAPLGSSHAA